jgi:hypothetical protein
MVSTRPNLRCDSLVSKFAFTNSTCTATEREAAGPMDIPNDLEEYQVGLSLLGGRLVTWNILAVIN